MGVTIKKASPLDGVPASEKIKENLQVLQSDDTPYTEKRYAAGWLRGAWLVLRIGDSKQQAAAKYINKIIREHKFPEDTRLTL